MIRYTLFVLAVIGSAASAIAAINPQEVVAMPKHETVIAKNQVWPVLGPIVVEKCAKEDCSDTPAS